MSWTQKVHCTCGANDWRAAENGWQCECGKPMTTGAVTAYHRTLCNCPAKDRALVGNACQTCRKPMT